MGSITCSGVSGDTSNCSTVPRSFSRTMAAQGSMMANTVMTLSISEMAMNQASFWLALNHTRVALTTTGASSMALAGRPLRARPSSSP